MIRSDYNRPEIKKRATVDPKKRQFAPALFQNQEYAHRLNFYGLPPTANVTLEEFEEWAITRLKVLSELETCTFRNKNAEETLAYMTPILEKHLPLHSNSSRSSQLQAERRRDHYSHFILRLAFSSTEDLRRRFSRLETMLFRLRYRQDDDNRRERSEFINSLDFSWEIVDDKERAELGEQLKAATGSVFKKGDEEGYFKVDFEKVPELVEQRRCMLRRGMAYVPMREQMSLVVAEYTARLDRALDMTARELPRIDEDDRLSPILAHLSHSFTAPSASYDESNLPSSLHPTAANIDQLATHFPLCMSHLHTTLRTNAHLKHYGRLQYTLFLKGLGLSLDECVLFWRRSFRLMTDDKFTKEYKYNIRHAYGDVGGDANRRGRGYSPYSCQKLITEPLPGAGQSHGCPYRTFNVENLVSLLNAGGISDKEVVRGVREDVGKMRYHVACNRVFEHVHRKEIKDVKDKGTWGAAELDTLLHPNTYFKRSFMLKHLGDEDVQAEMKREKEGPMKREIESNGNEW
ncbi:DNA primase, large subunit [Microthyrium microscopicum]|uniref:DNA primase large subunit n=1 Tax=Microthyrium microscopicum TaxID=703497 RepID=A0A6A6UDX4_9PEZI|nr:DNA primase, large subunit [Microthyrium microscopicum]